MRTGMERQHEGSMLAVPRPPDEQMPKAKTTRHKSGRKSSRRTLMSPRLLPKAATGIEGLDEITGGGLPKNRPTLLCGGAGCGKTMLAMEFLVRGALESGEPGVFMSFEETELDLVQNAAPMG